MLYRVYLRLEQTSSKLSRISLAGAALSNNLSCSIKDKNGDTAFDLLQPEDDKIRNQMRKAQAQNSIAAGDIADDGE